MMQPGVMESRMRQPGMMEPRMIHPRMAGSYFSNQAVDSQMNLSAADYQTGLVAGHMESLMGGGQDQLEYYGAPQVGQENTEFPGGAPGGRF